MIPKIHGDTTKQTLNVSGEIGKKKQKSKGGGIQLLVPTNLNPAVRPDLLTHLKNIEMTAVEIDATPGSLYERVVMS